MPLKVRDEKGQPCVPTPPSVVIVPQTLHESTVTAARQGASSDSAVGKSHADACAEHAANPTRKAPNCCAWRTLLQTQGARVRPIHPSDRRDLAADLKHE